MWESHSDREPSSDAGQDQDSLGGSDDSRQLRCLRTDLQELQVCTGMDSRVPVSGVGVSSRNVETPRKVGEGDGQLAPLEAISSLATRLLRMAQEGRLVDEKAPSEGEMGSLSAVSQVSGAERGHSVKEWGKVCFSCGRQRHGVNRCSQVDTSFPFLPPGWLVDVRIGQYQATQTDGTGLGSTPGNEGWSGREGKPPGSSGIKVRLTQAGKLVVQGDVSRLGSCRWGVDSVRTPLGFEHTGLSAIGEPLHERSWTELTEATSLSRYIPRPLMMRVILQLSVPVDSRALLFLILWRPLGRILAPWMRCLFWNR